MLMSHFRDIFAHTPEICYPAAGFEILNPPEQVVIDDSEFFTTTFRKSDNVTGTRDERGYWSWTADGNWYAPEDERGPVRRRPTPCTSCMSSPRCRTRRAPAATRTSAATSFGRLMPVVKTSLRPGFDDGRTDSQRRRRGDSGGPAEPPPAAKQRAAPAT